MSWGTLTLHRFNGDEIFNVATADICYFTDYEKTRLEFQEPTPPGDAGGWIESDPYDETRLEFQVFTDPEPVLITTNENGTGGTIDAVWQVVVSEFHSEAMVGQTFLIPEGYINNDGACEYRTNFYYHEHETINESEIAILRLEGDRFWVRIVGVMPDVNDPYKSPKMRIELEASFSFSESTTKIRPVG